MTNARRPRIWPLWALVIAHLLGDLAVACHDIPGVSTWSPADRCLIYAQIGLLAWWAVGTPGRPLLKCGGWALGMVWLTMLLSLSSFSTAKEMFSTAKEMFLPFEDFVWLHYLSVGTLALYVLVTAPAVLVAIAIVSAVLRFRGVRLLGPTQPVGPPLVGVGRKRIQFSLGELLMFMTGLAVALSLITALQPYPRWIVEFPGWWWHFAFSSGFMVLFANITLETTAATLLAAWALCGKRRPAVTFAAVPFLLLAIAAASILLVTVPLNMTHGFQTDWAHVVRYTGIHDVITFTFLATSFLVIRCCGYCYTRPPSESGVTPAG